MKKKLSVTALSISLLTLTACGNTSENKNIKNISEKIITEQTEEKSLNSLMLVFENLMKDYLKDNKKSLKGLEAMHLSFVPILHFEKFKGDENYKKAALSVGQIVHNLEELEGDDYQNLLDTLNPSFDKFYATYGQ